MEMLFTDGEGFIKAPPVPEPAVEDDTTVTEEDETVPDEVLKELDREEKVTKEIVENLPPESDLELDTDS